MASSVLRGAIIAATLAVVACGSSSPPTSPSTSTNTNLDLISILGERGSQSFSPNPAPAGKSQLQWTNSDSITHRIVANDGSFDTGNIAPGATSTVVVMMTDGTNYHCSIHPTMIGAVNSNEGPPPPCRGDYC